jgi:hypothetical protein
MMQDATSDNDRSACLKQAESCLEQAGQDVSRRTYWIAQAAEWIRRARGGSETETNSEMEARPKTREDTHQVSEGRLVPKSPAK